MTTTTAARPWLSRRRRLELLGAKLVRADQALSRNWTTQIVVIALAVVALRADVLQQFAQHHFAVRPAEEVLSGALALLLMYHFVRFGFLAGQFVHLRRCCDHLADGSDDEECTPRCDESHRKRLFETTNFFEPLTPGFHATGPAVLAVMVLATSAALGLSHAATFLHLQRALETSAWVAHVTTLLLLIGCYVQMWRSPVGRSSAVRTIELLAPVCAVGALLWLG